MSILDADKIYSELIAAGDDWADKDAAAGILEETKRSILAQLTIDRDDSVSRLEREQLALAGPVYRGHIIAMCEARKIANKAKVRYQAIQTLAELRRSQESTRRQEMRLV